MKKHYAVKSLLIFLTLLLGVSFLFTACSSKGYADSEKPSYDYDDYNDSSSGSVITYNKASSLSDPIEEGKTNEEYAEKIIKTVTLTGETKEFDNTLDAVRTSVASFGGYVESARVNDGTSWYSASHARTASFTLRIPAEKLDAFVSQVGNTLNVISHQETAQNVSDEYYDVKAILETLTTERASLLAMMESLNTAEQYDFWYKLETRISEIEKQIASYTATLNRLDSQVSYSTVTLSFSEVIEYTKEEDPTFGERLGNAFVDSWVAFGEGFQDFTVWLLEAIPTLLILAGIGAAIFFIVRAIIRKDKKLKNTKQDQETK